MVCYKFIWNEMKNRALFVLLTIIFLSVVVKVNFPKTGGMRHLRPYLSDLFIGYEVKVPLPGEDFVVLIESGYPEPYFRKVIAKAFPEYKVIFTEEKTIAPQLVFRDYYRSSEITTMDELQNFVPYISSNGEPGDFMSFRSSGYPFMQFNTFQTNEKHHEYVPFAAIPKYTLKDELPKAQSNYGQYKSPRKKGIAYIHTNCQPNRDKLFFLLKEKLGNKIHALSKCPVSYVKTSEDQFPIPSRGGEEGPGNAGWAKLKDIYSDYNLVFAMENTNREGYITEKIINAYEGGAIPIFWGHSETASRFFNPKSYIDVSDFNSLEEARDYIVDILNSQKKLEEYLNQPMYTDINKIDPILFINQPTLGNKEEVVIDNMAKKLRKLYFETIARRGNRYSG